MDNKKTVEFSVQMSGHQRGSINYFNDLKQLFGTIVSDKELGTLKEITQPLGTATSIDPTEQRATFSLHSGLEIDLLARTLGAALGEKARGIQVNHNDINNYGVSRKAKPSGQLIRIYFPK